VLGLVKLCLIVSVAVGSAESELAGVGLVSFVLVAIVLKLVVVGFGMTVFVLVVWLVVFVGLIVVERTVFEVRVAHF